MIHVTASVALMLLAQAETLDVEFRAVTLAVNERRVFHVPHLDRVTGSTGRCVAEGLDSAETQSFWVQGLCSGMRTVMVWKKNGRRMHLLTCVEGDDASSDVTQNRNAISNELKAMRSVTVCARNGRIEVWGWTQTPKEMDRINAILTKYDRSSVRNFVERIEE